MDDIGCPECGHNTCMCDGSPNNPYDCARDILDRLIAINEEIKSARIEQETLRSEYRKITLRTK